MKNMEKNIIFYFTGTGNSLQAAKIIAKQLENCTLQLVSTYDKLKIPAGYDRIVFIYPVYSGQPPRCMMEFTEKTDFSANPASYYFQVASCGGTTGNSVYWMAVHLQKKGVKLSAAYKISSKPNYIASYPITKDVTTRPGKARKKAEEIGKLILAKETTKLQNKPVKLFTYMNTRIAPKFTEMDRDYNVSDDCISCGICAKVCPVNNIEMKDGKPTFKHNCEQCMACIHNCPKQALNYKNVTAGRIRYRNPDVSLEELYRK